MASETSSTRPLLYFFNRPLDRNAIIALLLVLLTAVTLAGMALPVLADEAANGFTAWHDDASVARSPSSLQ